MPRTLNVGMGPRYQLPHGGDVKKQRILISRVADFLGSQFSNKGPPSLAYGEGACNRSESSYRTRVTAVQRAVARQLAEPIAADRRPLASRFGRSTLDATICHLEPCRARQDYEA